MADLLAAYHFGQCAAISSLETAGSERRRSASAIAQSVSPSLTTCSRGASSTGSVAREPLVGSRVATPPGSAGGAPHPRSTSAAEWREVVSSEAGESAGASVPGGGGARRGKRGGADRDHRDGRPRGDFAQHRRPEPTEEALELARGGAEEA